MTKTMFFNDGGDRKFYWTKDLRNKRGWQVVRSAAGQQIASLANARKIAKAAGATNLGVRVGTTLVALYARRPGTKWIEERHHFYCLAKALDAAEALKDIKAQQAPPIGSRAERAYTKMLQFLHVEADRLWKESLHEIAESNVRRRNAPWRRRQPGDRA